MVSYTTGVNFWCIFPSIPNMSLISNKYNYGLCNMKYCQNMTECHLVFQGLKSNINGQLISFPLSNGIKRLNDNVVFTYFAVQKHRHQISPIRD